MAPTEPRDLADDLADVHERFARTAADVDAGARDVREGLRWLGSRGLLQPAADRGERVGAAVRLLRTLAAASLADAFAAWSQGMVVEYLTCCPPPAGVAPVLEHLVSGELPGATALAPAVADVAGGPPVPVVAEPTADGWSLSGPVPWASNLFPDAVLVVPARTGDGGRLVAVLPLGAPGVRTAPPAPLLALGATATGSATLDATAVPADAVLTHDLSAFLGLCRPTMLLTQAAMALGVADAALASTAAALDGPAAALGEEHRALAARRDAVAARLTALAAGRGASTPADPALVRLDALDLVARAVELEGPARGGTGFRAASPTSRRRREAAFLPLQAPTLVQLRAAVAAAARSGSRPAT